MRAEPQKEHQWIHKLVGEWTFDSECNMGPDQPAMSTKGSEVVRSLGGLWTVAEADAEMSGAPGWKSIMTLGFDPTTGRFVGTFIATMMAYMWQYSGSLDAAGKVLTLDTEGPNFTDGKLTKYQDIIEFFGNESRTLSSRILGENGEWKPFMKATYTRRQ